MPSRSSEHAPVLRAVDSVARRRLRYRLAVAAPSAAEVVRLAGGWLFDHVIAGWDVVVLTAQPGDERALQILGATAIDLDTALDTPRRGVRVDIVAAATSLYESDERVRTRLRAAVDKGVTDARLWDTRHPQDTGHLETYRPTTAAQAFKAQALAATTIPHQATPIELFQPMTPVRAYTSV